MQNLRLKSDPVPPTEVFGWTLTHPDKHHHFAIKNICSYVGPSMVYDQALNTNYYAIHVDDPSRVEEIRKNFENISFTIDDIAGTRLTYYTKATLTRKYMESIDEKI